jgi:hypothetical protein
VTGPQVIASVSTLASLVRGLPEPGFSGRARLSGYARERTLILN